VRIHFQEIPWDLHLCFLYTISAAGLLVIVEMGNLAAILLILFVPGYVLMAALFPRAKEIDWIERVALSLGLSIAVVPLLALLLNFTPWGIRLALVVTTVTFFTIGVGAIAYWRRMRLPPDKRLGATLDLALPVWKEYGRFDKGLTIALTASVVVAGGTLVYLVLTPRAGETFTEFYILGPGGKASGYPTALNVSQPGTVILGVANQESASVKYTIRVDLIGVLMVYNATSGFNETVEVNRTTWSTFNVTLADGKNWTQPYTFRIDYVGLWKVQFLLFIDGEFSSIYRNLHLFVRVT